MAGALAEQITLKDSIIIRINKSKGKQVLRQRFDDYFLSNLKKDSINKKVEIYHSFSHSWSGLQFADMLAWSYFQKFERETVLVSNIVMVDCNFFHLNKE